MQIDPIKFFENYKKHFVGSLNQSQVDGLNSLIKFINNDSKLTDIRQISYVLSTTYHETAGTYQPIREYGSRQYFVNRYGGHTALGKRLGNDTPEEGAIYAGRGDVQLTGESNYERLEEDIRKEYPEAVTRFEMRTGKKFDLTVGDQPNDLKDPENASDPEIAYAIMSFGMRHGRFTGRKLSDFINANQCDYVNARRIINGMDKSSLIAGYAKKFERILNQSVI